MPPVEIRGLTKRFGATLAVDGLGFTAAPGRVTGFLGPNGAGKTTTLRALLGLVTPTAGQATVGGRAYRDLDHPLRTVGAVLEASGFHPTRSAVEHLRVLATAADLPRGRAEDVLGLVGLADAAGRPVAGFSLGMRQRLALAAALLGDPGVLVLDEPANGLDPEGIRWLRGIQRTLAAEGRTVLVSSHVLAEVAQTVDDVVIIARGRLVVEAPLESVTSRVAAVRVRSPGAAELAERLRAGGAEVSASDGALTVRGLTPADVGEAAFAAGVAVHELTAIHEDLEAAFFDLTTGSAPGARGGSGEPGSESWAPVVWPEVPSRRRRGS